MVMVSSADNFLLAAQCSAAMSEALRGAWITRLEYLNTSWEIGFCLPDSNRAVLARIIEHPHELVLEAAAEQLGSVQADAALVMQLVICTEHTVHSVEVAAATSAITVSFSNDVRVSFPGHAGLIDEVWSLYDPSKQAGRRRQFGEQVFVQSYAGLLHADSEFLLLGVAP
jgi:hypothetical protein